MLSTITFTMLASLALAGPVGEISAGVENKLKEPPKMNGARPRTSEITETEMEVSPPRTRGTPGLPPFRSPF